MSRFLLSICFAAVFFVLMPVDVFASPFRDVPRTHFAYDAINFARDPANGAFMVGDIHGNFNPRRSLTKFEASRIFALAAGFRHVLTTISVEQQELQHRALVMWRPYLNFLANEYGRWQSSHDGEIAFLLYKGILTIDDVNEFILRQGQNESHAEFLVNNARLWSFRLAKISESEIESFVEMPDVLNRSISRAELAVMLYDVLYRPSEQTAGDYNLNQFARHNFTSPFLMPDFASEAELDTVTINGRVITVRIDVLSRATVQSADGSLFTFYVESNVMDILNLRVGMLVSADIVGTRAININVWGSAW